jgi:branched-chain amino acid transport system substrate-binding protein
MAKQAKELGSKLQIIGADAATDPHTIEVGGDATEGMLSTSPKLRDAPEFVKNLKEKKGADIMLCVPNGYDAANLVFDAIVTVGNDGEKIRDYLYAVEAYDGVSGVVSFDSNGDIVGAEYAVNEVINSEWVMG